MVSLSLLDWYERSWTHTLWQSCRPSNQGIAVHSTTERGKGYGVDATRIALWIGFHVLGLHSIHLDTMEQNSRAIHVAEKVGFRRVGMFRETEFIDGAFRGLVYYDILRQEFDDLYPKLDCGKRE